MAVSVLLTGAALFGAAVQGLAYVGPRATGLVAIPSDALAPRPTFPPNIQELRKRATSSPDVFLVAPDNTCGYVSGQLGAAYTCNGATDLCVFITSTAGTPGAVGCCNTQDCGFRTTCLDFVQISSSSLCDNGCLVDTLRVKCTNSALQFCNTVSFSGGAIDFFCNSLSISTPQAALTTFSGETDKRSFSPLTAGDETSGLNVGSITTQSTSSSSSSSSTTSAAAASGGGGGSSANAGAIAGGVVGGVAVIGLIGLGVAFLLRHNKKQQQPAAGVPPTPQMQQQPPTYQGFSPDPASSHQSYYGPPADPTKMGPHVQQQQQQQAPHMPNPSPPAQYGAAYAQPPHPGALVPGQMPMPDRNDSASPSASSHYRVSQLGPASPNSVNQASFLHMSQQSFPGYQPPQPGMQQYQPVYEAGSNPVGPATDYNANHRGQMHELG